MEPQYVKRWPADLAVWGSSPTGGGDHFNHRLATSLSLSPTQRPDMDVNSQVIHPSILSEHIGVL